MNEIIIVGSGGHARSCIDVIELSGQYKIAGLVEKDGSNREKNLGYPVVGTDEDLVNLRKKYQYALITVGQIKSAKTRVQLFNLVKNLEYKLPLIVSPRSHVSRRSKIGDGTIIMHDVIVNINSKIGKNCIINNHSLIEHDAIIGNHCHIATGAIINGEVSVGDKTFIGSGAITKQRISINNNCIIGAGVILKNDVASNQVIKN
mgnify:CR=1 FL=1